MSDPSEVPRPRDWVYPDDIALDEDELRDLDDASAPVPRSPRRRRGRH